MLGNLIVAALVLFVITASILTVRLMLVGPKKFELLKQQTLARAVEAAAEILRVTQASGSSTRGGVRRVGLRLELEVRHPLLGPYRTTSVWLVEEVLIPQVRAGRVLPVLVNSEAPERVYPKQAGMEFADWVFMRI